MLFLVSTAALSSRWHGRAPSLLRKVKRIPAGSGFQVELSNLDGEAAPRSTGNAKRAALLPHWGYPPASVEGAHPCIALPCAPKSQTHPRPVWLIRVPSKGRKMPKPQKQLYEQGDSGILQYSHFLFLKTGCWEHNYGNSHIWTFVGMYGDNSVSTDGFIHIRKTCSSFCNSDYFPSVTVRPQRGAGCWGRPPCWRGSSALMLCCAQSWPVVHVRQMPYAEDLSRTSLP